MKISLGISPCPNDTYIFDALINNKIDCELILLERTHHDTTIVEFIAKTNIRKSLKIGNKSNIKIKISILGNFS